jgi:hypothetical protein
MPALLGSLGSPLDPGCTLGGVTRRLALAVLLALAPPTSVAAQASFTAQQRSVEATSHREAWLWAQGTNPFPPDFDPPTTIYPVNHSDSEQAPGFGSYSGSASSTPPPMLGVPDAISTAGATQTSSLAPGEIAVSGSFSTAAASAAIQEYLASINAQLQPPVPYYVGMTAATETGASHFSVDFQVTAPTPYQLGGSTTLSQSDIGSPGVPYYKRGSASVRLSSASGSLVDFTNPGCGCTMPLDYQGVLAPGSYTLEVELGGFSNAYCNLLGCVSPTMTGSLDLSLSLSGTPEVPGPSRALAALLAVALAAIGAVSARHR